MNRKRPLPRDAILAAKEQGEAWDEASDRRGEESRVMYLLKRFKMVNKKADMLRVSKSRTGVPRLTLDLFAEMVPTFPLLMAMAPRSKVNKLHMDDKSTLVGLTRNFRTAPFVAAYEDMYGQAEREANGRAIALLFNRKGIRQGYVLHNNEGLACYWQPGFFAGFRGGTRDKPVLLVLQAFSVLVDSIYDNGRGWKPEFAF